MRRYSSDISLYSRPPISISAYANCPVELGGRSSLTVTGYVAPLFHSLFQYDRKEDDHGTAEGTDLMEERYGNRLHVDQ